MDGGGEVGALTRRLDDAGYVADPALATVLFLADRLGSPLLLEGEPGVGKTSLAQAYAQTRGARLIRLQCYEGLAAHHALYEWDYARQMVAIRAAEATGGDRAGLERDLFDQRFLLRRPLLEAIWPSEPGPVVLLIDEVDRADEEFEALLLELLSDYQVTIPELGTITAATAPTIILTSNRTRTLSDALRRRCLYHWLPFPSLDRELDIIRHRLPGVDQVLARAVCRAVLALRAGHYRKSPGVSETLDWLAALTAIGAHDLTAEVLSLTAGCVLKDPEDLDRVVGDADRILDAVRAGSA